jgi:electron transfer flavoprotein alpha subunit
MSGILVVAEARRGALRDISFEVIRAGRELAAAAGDPLVVAIVDPDPGSLGGALTLDGVDEVLEVATGSEHFDAAVVEAALAALVDAVAPRVVLMGHTVDALAVAPALAARRGLGLATDVIGLGWENGAPTARRALFGGKLEAELDFPGHATVVLLVRAGVWPAASGNADVPRRSVAVELPPPALAHERFVEVEVADVDITTADFLLSVGRGIGDQDSLEQLEDLAQRLGATLSVSRPLVDAGWVSSDRQVGQSGRTVKPKVYLALGISGAVQHLAGIRGAETIIAVNSDAEAPIFGVADYGAVADLFDVVDELARLADSRV